MLDGLERRLKKLELYVRIQKFAKVWTLYLKVIAINLLQKNKILKIGLKHYNKTFKRYYEGTPEKVASYAQVKPDLDGQK